MAGGTPALPAKTCPCRMQSQIIQSSLLVAMLTPGYYLLLLRGKKNAALARRPRSRPELWGGGQRLLQQFELMLQFVDRLLHLP